MTTVQNVKYMQSIYRKFQIFAIVCALLTLIFASLAALSGIQLNSLREAQAKALENATMTSSQVNADVQKELKESKLFLKSSQQQLNEEKEKVERLQQMLNTLERQLSAAQSKAAPKPDEADAPKPEKSPAVSATPKAHRKPAPTPVPTPNAPQSSDGASSSDASDNQIPATEAIAPSFPSPAPPKATDASGAPDQAESPSSE